MEHGRIESRICRIYRGEELIVDKEKWNGHLTVIEILTSTEKKSDSRSTSEQRLYISSLDSSAELLSQITKQYWAIESMHWELDCNLRQDSIKRKDERAARNLDTIQRMVLALIAVWKNRRKKYQISKRGRRR
ncbi:ISAs1 family transposase [Bacteroides bouchesdurhonensis]|uniref:ISAs1 family transposase n=1 Tax=Bacteroides bouchesdurhonensis TaxID=1841855 RepID=UPI0021CDE60D|nr:ISAs1 family transposase [Bacteroides bouchesdurhonensis]